MAVPITTGAMDAQRVLGLAASSQTETAPGGSGRVSCLTDSPLTNWFQGRLGNLEKSGLRFSTKAFLPSWPSSVM